MRRLVSLIAYSGNTRCDSWQFVPVPYTAMLGHLYEFMARIAVDWQDLTSLSLFVFEFTSPSIANVGSPRPVSPCFFPPALAFPGLFLVLPASGACCLHQVVGLDPFKRPKPRPKFLREVQWSSEALYQWALQLRQWLEPLNNVLFEVLHCNSSEADIT